MEARTMELKEARFKRRITQYSLSKITGVHQSRISLIENG
jgi:transcriptional regulator with XRE-family HTH domain